MRPLARLFNADALRDNWRAVRRRAAAQNVLAVVKSRAYGHGLAFAAEALRDTADGFGVVEMKDAEELRTLGIDKPILLMSGTFNEADAARAAELKLWTAVHNAAQIESILKLPSQAEMTVFVKVDIGMNRLGFSPEEAGEVMDSLSRAPQVARTVLMAHFAVADSPDATLAAPLKLIAPLRPKASFASLGNSAATLLHDDIGDDWARVGIALYGASPAPAWQNREALGLRAVMTLQTEIIAVREVPPGSAVGYGGEWCAKRTSRIGIIACGYGDGYPRRSGMQVQVGGVLAPVVGRVSMELTALDITGIEAGVGTKAVLWGDALPVDDVASSVGCIAYELLTAAGR